MKTLLTATALILAPTIASAHPGQHDEITGWDAAVQHLLGSPFHLALVAGAIMAAGLAVIVMKKRRSDSN